MNKTKKFYSILNITLIVVTVLYSFTALANKHPLKVYQDKNRHHFYSQIGFGSLLTNLNIRDHLSN